MKTDHSIGYDDSSNKFLSKLCSAPKDISDPGIFHKLVLIPFFAWIGLGVTSIFLLITPECSMLDL